MRRAKLKWKVLTCFLLHLFVLLRMKSEKFLSCLEWNSWSAAGHKHSPVSGSWTLARRLQIFLAGSFNSCAFSMWG